MADTLNDSRATYSGGMRGFIVGAIIGAVVASILGVIFAMLNFGEGGPGMHAMAGAAFGGLVGFMFGIVSARRRIPRA